MAITRVHAVKESRLLLEQQIYQNWLCYPKLQRPSLVDMLQANSSWRGYTEQIERIEKGPRDEFVKHHDVAAGADKTAYTIKTGGKYEPQTAEECATNGNFDNGSEGWSTITTEKIDAGPIPKSAGQVIYGEPKELASMFAKPQPVAPRSISVLDHGFVRLVDHMGDDSAIVQAARVSYGEGTKTPSDDKSLIRYLLRHQHTTPFEMVEFKFHMRLPMFVARQMIRYRTTNVNEYSARYSVVPDLFYVPQRERWGRQSTTNKQGTGEPYTPEFAGVLSETVNDISEAAFEVYNTFISDDADVSRELARIILPQNAYTEWYWKIDLHNLLRVIRQRVDSHAQWEIQQYGQAMLDLIAPVVPIAIQAWRDYSLNAVTFSAQEMDILRRVIKDTSPLNLVGDLSKREFSEFLGKLKL